MEEDYIKLIEAYKHDNSKEACSILNNLKSHLGGGWVENCFCSSVDRMKFIKDFNEWYKNYLEGKVIL